MEGYERNKPCHCGSGKKYKKCCYAKDADQNYKQLTARTTGLALEAARRIIGKKLKVKKEK